MTQIWKDEEVVPVTKIQAGPCVVTQVKSEDKDGYKGVQVAFDNKKEKNIKKPQKGHFQKLKQLNKRFKTNWRYAREFRLVKDEDKQQEVNVGDIVGVDIFESNDKVDVSGTSKGRGFQGVVKRHGFSGAMKTHGIKDQERMPGSAGAMGVGRIFKGKRMPGRMGGQTITTRNLEVVDIDAENNILFLKGAVSGAVNGLVAIKGKGELKVKSAEEAAGVLEEGAATKKQEPVEKKKEENAGTEEAKETKKTEETTKQEEGGDNKEGQESQDQEQGEKGKNTEEAVENKEEENK